MKVNNGIYIGTSSASIAKMEAGVSFFDSSAAINDSCIIANYLAGLYKRMRE
ncbi:MAG: hypothetical protein LAT75_12980 [Candidatus Cyclonatronum sp.]|uniref:hypothetical protein n=1 Tax=Cyclonatronum sp. TaxID=3024185 RepID=UPI0025C1BB2F|nr:hypothetical protein [Cyclonatronum sp.]MCH8487776.1 hypothetical protein [Cyclonatronum sp.]